MLHPELGMLTFGEKLKVRVAIRVLSALVDDEDNCKILFDACKYYNIIYDENIKK